VKLGSIPDRLAGGCWRLAILVTTLTGCVSAPSQPVIERLDPNTATTLTVIKKPVELLAESIGGPSGDPFAFIAPFETDRMGTRAQYLWMSAPSIEGAKLELQLLCDGQPVTLPPVEGDVEHLGLSHAPYQSPAPWSMQQYFQLPRDTLQCLAEAQKITLETRPVTGEVARFTVERKDLTELRAFSSR